MQWIIALVCIFALMSGTSDSTDSVATPLLNALMVFLGSMLIPVFTAWQTSGVLRRLESIESRETSIVGTLKLFHAMHIITWIAYCILVTAFLKWGLVVRNGFGMANVPLVDEVIILIPILFPLLAGWAVLFDLEKFAHIQNSANPDSAKVQQSRWEYVGIRAKWYLVMSVVPLLIMWLARDIAILPQPWIDQTTWSVGICSLFFVAKIAAFPFLMAAIWDTRTIKNTTLGRRLYKLAQEKRVQIWDVRLWHTGKQVVNAVVSGIFPRLRIIFLTDRLIDELDERQIESVFRHELTHAQRMHLPIRIAIVLLPLLVYLIASAVNPVGIRVITGIGESTGISSQWVQFTILPTLYVTYLYVVLGWLSRKMEFDADIGACFRESTEDSELPDRLDPEAAHEFGQALLRISISQNVPTGKRGWLHPSVQERYEFLRQIRKEPQVASRFKQRLQLQILVAIASILIAGTMLCIF